MLFLMFCFKLLINKINNIKIYSLTNLIDYNNITFIDNHKITEIHNNINKKKLLDNLKNENISIINKLQLLNELENPNNINQINLFNGGLFNDWNFLIENI
jgi:hypothetical protein